MHQSTSAREGNGRPGLRYAVLFMAVALVAALFGGRRLTPAHADTPVSCSIAALASAINAANIAGSGTLVLASNCTYTFDVSTPGPLEITGDITIDGNGATITGATMSAFLVDSGATLDLSALTLSGNHQSVTGTAGAAGASSLTPTAGGNGVSVSAMGGAIYNDGGSVNLTGCTLRDNSVSAAGGGGGAGGSNTSPDGAGASGGAGGNATALGGAIYNYEGTLAITDSTLTGNAVSAAGGAGAPGGAAEQERAGARGGLWIAMPWGPLPGHNASG